MMIAAERRELIVQKIKASKFVSIQELSKEFSVTEMTIRRDLDFLTRQGLIKRSHGGALINDKVGLESEFDTRKIQLSEIKEVIGKKAASLISAGDCIAIDCGTTAYEVSRFISNIPDLKVITASIPVIAELLQYPQVNVICTGGELSIKDKSLVGSTAIRTIQDYILDKVFIGVAGISFDFGFTMFNMNDTLVKRAFIDRAREVIVVADSSKIGVTRHAYFCEIEKANKIITDSGISNEDYQEFINMGIEVIIADKDKVNFGENDNKNL